MQKIYGAISSDYEYNIYRGSCDSRGSRRSRRIPVYKEGCGATIRAWDQSGQRSQNGDVQPTPKDVPPVGSVVIEMNENGFTPDTVTIQKDTTVVFKNVGTEQHWPASDIHPTHGIYPEFDPQRPVPAGESWSFAFAKVGRWRMHDHLMPRNVGAITVTE